METKNIFYKKGMGKFIFILLWLFYFPLAMWVIKKSEGSITVSRFLMNFLLFAVIWISSIFIISKLI